MEMIVARILHCTRVLLESANEGHPTSDENRIMQLDLIHLSLGNVRANYTNESYAHIFTTFLPFLFRHNALYLTKDVR